MNEELEEMEYKENESKVERHEASWNQVMEAAKKSGTWINRQQVQQKLVKKVQVKAVIKAYFKVFDDREEKKPYIDLSVQVLNEGELKEREMSLTLGKMNINKMSELFGSDPNSWVGKVLRLSTTTVMGKQTIVIDEE